MDTRLMLYTVAGALALDAQHARIRPMFLELGLAK